MDGEKPGRCKDTEAGMKKGKRWYLFPFFSHRYPNYLPEANFNIFSKPNYIEIKKKKPCNKTQLKQTSLIGLACALVADSDLSETEGDLEKSVSSFDDSTVTSINTSLWDKVQNAIWR